MFIRGIMLFLLTYSIGIVITTRPPNVPSKRETIYKTFRRHRRAPTTPSTAQHTLSAVWATTLFHSSHSRSRFRCRLRVTSIVEIGSLKNNVYHRSFSSPPAQGQAIRGFVRRVFFCRH